MLLTAPGAAAIAVVRIVGPRVSDFLAAHFSRAVSESRAVHGELRDGEQLIDDPLVSSLPNNAGVEIHLHGGPWVVQACLDLAKREGFTIVDRPLEDLEAFDGGSIIEREVAAALPLATTELGIRVLLAQSSVWIDSFTPEQAASILRDRALWWLLHPPRVAIVGAANVGKSTLANQLFAQKRSIVADVPGTTRDWVGEIANLDGLAIMLIDTPGVRETSDSIERVAIDRARAQMKRADLIVQVLDATRPLFEQPRFADDRTNVLRIANKIDRQQCWDLPKHADIQTVATSGEGIESLRRAIRSRFGCDSIDPDQPMWWTQRQHDLLRERAAANA